MMTQPRRTSLRTSLVVVGLALIVMGAIGVLQAWRRADANVAATADDMARTLAAIVVDDVHRLDVRGLRGKLADLRMHAGASQVYVTDADGVVLADGTSENLKRDQKLDDHFAGELVRSRRWMSAAGDGDVKVGGPIETADGSILGFVVVTLASGNAAVVRAAAESALAGAVFLGICVGFLWLVSKREGAGQPAAPSAAGANEVRRPASRAQPAATALAVEAADTGFARPVIEHLLNAIGEVVVLVDAAGKIISINKTASGLLGYDAEELIGRAAAVLFGDDLGDTTELVGRTALSRVARMLTCKDGSRRPVWLSTVVVRASDGSLREIVCLARLAGPSGVAEEALGATAIESADTTVEMYRQEVEEQQRKLAEAGAEIEALRTRVQKSVEQLATERARCGAEVREQVLAEQAEAIRQEESRRETVLREAQERMRKIEEERAETLARCEAAEAARGEAQRDIEQIRQELRQAREDLDKTRAQMEVGSQTGEGTAVSGPSEAVEAAEGEAEVAREQMAAVRLEADELRAQVEAVRSDLDEARQQNEVARREAEDARVQQRAAEEQLEAARREAKNARNEAEALRQRPKAPAAVEVSADASRAERDHLEESLKQAREERDLLAQELERTQAYWKQQEEHWKAEKAAQRPEPLPAAAAPSAESAAPSEVGEQPVLDRDEALAGVDGDLDFLKALVDVFMESSARQMAEIGASIERGDAGSLERTARMLKGVVGTFGARAAAAAALQVETIGIVADMDRAADAYEKLDAEIERLKPALMDLVSGGER